MNQSTVSDTILKYIRNNLASQAPHIDVDTALFEEGFLDSTAMLELILWIGDTFKITIGNDDLTPENFASIRNMVEFVQRNRSAASTVEQFVT
jgi:acyl carrier protein